MKTKTHFTDKQIHEIQKNFEKKNQEFSNKIECIHSDIDQDQLQDLADLPLQNEDVYVITEQHK